MWFIATPICKGAKSAMHQQFLAAWLINHQPVLYSLCVLFIYLFIYSVNHTCSTRESIVGTSRHTIHSQSHTATRISTWMSAHPARFVSDSLCLCTDDKNTNCLALCNQSCGLLWTLVHDTRNEWEKSEEMDTNGCDHHVSMQWCKPIMVSFNTWQTYCPCRAWLMLPVCGL